jgi:hypothetical protein
MRGNGLSYMASPPYQEINVGKKLKINLFMLRLSEIY